LARLSCSWTEEHILNAILDLLKANDICEDTYIRPWLFATGLVRDLMVPANARVELVIDCWPFVAAPAERSCRACVSSWTHISDRFMPPRVKAFSNYSNGRLGMIEAQMAGYDCPIFLNENGMVTESAGACIATVRNGIVYTPPLAAGILDSITRSTLITSLGENEIPIREVDLTRTDLYTADEAFFLGTGWEVLPISEVDGMPYSLKAPGPLTSRIGSDYSRLVRGQIPDSHLWLTPVWGPSRLQKAAASQTTREHSRASAL
jgi:branched-chain amino acid aminotransferase